MSVQQKTHADSIKKYPPRKTHPLRPHGMLLALSYIEGKQYMLWNHFKKALLCLKFLYLLLALLPAHKGFGHSCESFIQQQEAALGIPHQLLKSIALTESGKKTGFGQFVAWPWTINVNGKGYTYATKDEAITAVQKFQRHGISSIDVGCMQINLKHHPHAFRNLSDAFDPQLNVAYAARYLLGLREQYHSWYQAVAHYHSATPRHHIPYREKVIKAWQKMRQLTGNSIPALLDIQFTGENNPTQSEPSPLANPLVRFTAYKLPANNKPKKNEQPSIMHPPGQFRPLQATKETIKVNKRTFYPVNLVAIKNATKNFLPLR